MLFYMLILNFWIVVIKNHELPKEDDLIRGVFIEHSHSIKRRNINSPLRILLWYDFSVYRLEEDKFLVLNTSILPQVVKFYENALYIRKSENIIRLNRKCKDHHVYKKEEDYAVYCVNDCQNKTMCGEVQIPEEHLKACYICNSSGLNCQKTSNSEDGKGIENFDFVFYISAIETEKCNQDNTLAYASHCQQESALDRPIAGYANICPESISIRKHDIESLISTIKHELFHALGFSVSLYAFYRDNNGNPLTERRNDTGKPNYDENLQIFKWSEKIVKKIQRNWFINNNLILKRDFHMIVTPRVVEEVRNHFNCSILDGSELENQGYEGTSLSHWEKRLFENEAMTGIHTKNSILSRITLALMEDTGWYKVNYSVAQRFIWGKNLGCDFAIESCAYWIQNKLKKGESIYPYCNQVKKDPLQTECTVDRSSVALCNLVRFNDPLPIIYQNFYSLPKISRNETQYYGGSIILADYCPYIQEFRWETNNISIRSSTCEFEENNLSFDKNFALEKYGKNSKCFQHGNETWKEHSCNLIKEWRLFGSGCYEYFCHYGQLYIKVANNTYTCYYNGQIIHIEILLNNNWLRKGSIKCPSCWELCEEKCQSSNEQSNISSFKNWLPNSYQNIELKCKSSKLSPIFLLSILIILIYFYIRMSNIYDL